MFQTFQTTPPPVLLNDQPKNKPSVVRDRGPFPDETIADEDFRRMLGNEPGQNPEIESVENAVEEMEVIYHCIDCPYCCNGGVPFEYENGDVEWETCEFCNGLGHLPIIED